MQQEAKKTRLGALLISMGKLTQHELNRCLLIQINQKPVRLIGEILIDQNLITCDALADVLTKQRKMRSKSREIKALNMANFAMEAFDTSVDRAKAIKKKSDYVKKKSSGMGYPAIKIKNDEEERP